MARIVVALRLLSLLLWSVGALVDESGRYRDGSDLSSLAPPEPSQEDRDAAVNLSVQPPEKLFRLLAYELIQEDKRPPEKRLGIRAFQLATEKSCAERLAALAQQAGDLSKDVTVYHLNITGTAGLYWLLHAYPEEHSWVWVIAVSHERVLRKVSHHFSRMVGIAMDDWDGCLSPNFRTVIMNAAATWRKLHGDQMALLWNGVAFGLLGDVTSWREVDEESGQAADAPGGEPPNVSWSENLIFGNMWVSSVQKWLEYHAQELGEAVYVELARAQAGIPPDPMEQRWRQAEHGVLAPFEFLRRQLFSGWSLDKGLLRGVLRHCLQPSYGAGVSPPSLVDFASGGGRYSEWLNDTGLAQAFAVDATHAVGDITGKRVQELDLSKEVQMWRTFDWVLCLDVAGHMPESHVTTLFRNIRRHAERGLVMSWSRDAAAIAEPDFVALVLRETGFVLDRAATDTVRLGCESDGFSKTVAVFRASS